MPTNQTKSLSFWVLTDVLLRHIFRVALAVVPLTVLLAFLGWNSAIATSVAAGAFLSFSDGAGIVYLVGRLLEEGHGAPKKIFLVSVMLVKLVIAGGLLWYFLVVLKLAGLALVVGLGIGLGAVVWGASRGSSSKEGQAAMDAAEQEIEQQMRDNDADSR